MKNAIRLFGIIALVAVIGFAVVACGGGGDSKSGDSGALSGTYEGPYGVSFTFSGNKVTAAIGDIKMEATYEIKDGKIISTAEDGETTEEDYSLEGNKLTIGEYVLTKKE